MEPATVRYLEPDSRAPTDVVGPHASRRRRASAPIEPGERYLLGKPLGRGGMGEVLAAHDAHIGREIAIKRLHAEKRDPASLARFLREARIQGRLDHPAIPPVYELDHDDDGRPFFAMKKLSGHTLAEVLRDHVLRARFPRQRLLRAFVDVCLAIEFAHTHGVVHRDIKPSNVLLGDFGEVYVLDWGVARVVDDDAWQPTGSDDLAFADVTAAGSVVGTPGYMPPEQVLGRRDIDGRADVYSLGCVLFEILAERQLHPRGEAGLRSALRPVDARPSTTADDVPPELDDLCTRATAIVRDDRIGSARELGEAVQRYLEGDRDLTLRGRIADDHVAAARAALAIGDDEYSRRTAMREAGRALALDPTRHDAAEVIGRLMSSPPPTTPREVDDELVALDREAANRYARLSAYIHAGYLALALLLVVIYAHGGFYVVLLGTIASASAVLCEIACRRPSRTLDLAVIALNILTIAVFARMFTPFLFAPGLGAVTVMRLAFHPRAHRRFLVRAVAASAAAIFVVWFAEVAGLLSQTMAIHGGVIQLRFPIEGLDALPGAPGLCCFVLGLFTVAALLSHGSAQEQRMTRHRSHVQAWQLRQVVSRER
ncbi:MAG TPA: serine/threonine-protein kinase [Kofleriaceae bacterium]|nr:serine/threonine-protein kinase [Kofleriaceae bacterium]